MSERIYTTGVAPATPDVLRGLAWDVERWKRDEYAGDLEARVIAALLSHLGWEYRAGTPAVPAVKQGRKIVGRAKPAMPPMIYRHYRYTSHNGSGIESCPSPQILRDIGQAFGLMTGRVLLHLSDISGDGLSAAHVGGGPNMAAEGKAYGGATLAATLVAAILRCEARAREVAGGQE